MLSSIFGYIKGFLGLKDNSNRGQKRPFPSSNSNFAEEDCELMSKRRRGNFDDSENSHWQPFFECGRPNTRNIRYLRSQNPSVHPEPRKVHSCSPKYEEMSKHKKGKELEFKEPVRHQSFQRTRSEKNSKPDNYNYMPVNGNRVHLEREKVNRETGYKSVYDKMYNQAAHSFGRQVPLKGKQNVKAAESCIRLEEKERYRQLLQQMMSKGNFESVKAATHSIFLQNKGNFNGVTRSQAKQAEYFSEKSPRYPIQPRRALERSKLSSFDQNQCIRRINNLRLSQNSDHSQYRDISSSPEVIEVKISSIPQGSSKPSVDILPNGLPSLSKYGSAPSSSDRAKVSEKEIKEKISKNVNENPYCSSEWLNKWQSKYDMGKEITGTKIKETELELKLMQGQWQRIKTNRLETRIKENLTLAELQPAVIEDVVKPEEEEEEQFPELTVEMEEKIEDALNPLPADEVLVEAFRLQIRRKDMETLTGFNWLNDEIINFYMNLLIERGKKKDMPSVYACNTFFYPKLLSGGHTVLKRWTRKIDIFSHDILLVPIHLGVHWCLAVVDFRDKTLKYYDSMLGKNNECLPSLKGYLKAESLDKRKKELDLSDWTMESVKDIPQQMNSSDCGMFACKYAEYITRNAKITFKQEHMPYFRRRMVYEMLTQQLL